MTKFDNVIKVIEQLKDDIKRLKEISSLNSLAPVFYVQNKQVFETEKGIVRLTQRHEAEMRIMIYKYAEANGVNCLLPETLLDVSDDMFGLTIQEKITPVTFKSDEEVFSKLTTTEIAFLKDNSFMWVANGNCGLVGDKIKIFDYIANFSARKKENGRYALFGGAKGEELYES